MNITKRWDSHIAPWAHKQQTLQESPPPLSHDDLHVKRSTSSPDIRPKNIVFHMVSFDFFALNLCFIRYDRYMSHQDQAHHTPPEGPTLPLARPKGLTKGDEVSFSIEGKKFHLIAKTFFTKAFYIPHPVYPPHGASSHA